MKTRTFFIIVSACILSAAFTQYGFGETEPNDTPATADTDLIGGTSVAGTLTLSLFDPEAGDFDFYKLPMLLAGETIAITFQTSDLGGQFDNYPLAIEIYRDGPAGIEKWYIMHPLILPGTLATRNTFTFRYVNHVDGDYFVAIRQNQHFTGSTTTWNYQLTRSNIQQAGLRNLDPRTKQTIFLDFDGARISQSKIIANGSSTTMVTIPPLDERYSSTPTWTYMTNWSLEPTEIDVVLDKVIDIIQTALNNVVEHDQFSYILLNSRDHTEPDANDPTTTRIYFGAQAPDFNSTLAATIQGAARRVDTGNLHHDDDCIIFLDTLSDDSSNPFSINHYGVDPSASKADFVGTALGNLAGHELGHLLGADHTGHSSAFLDNTTYNLVSFGSFYQDSAFQLGPDDVFGTADDIQSVGYFPDVLVFTDGSEKPIYTDEFIRWGLSTNNPCPADLNGNGVVEGVDLIILLGNWNSTTCEFDLDGTCLVRGIDLCLLLGAWGSCP